MGVGEALGPRAGAFPLPFFRKAKLSSVAVTSEASTRLRLLLLRHAKSDWSGNETDDHDRPLSARGRDAAPRMGAYMVASGYEPALVLCSTARRTRETVKLLLAQLRTRPAIRYRRGLYLAEWPHLLEEVRDATAGASLLLIVGHNPGMQQLALALQSESAAEKAQAQQLAQKFPTAALAVFDIEGESWRGVKPGAGKLIDYRRPKDLPDATGAGA